MKQSPQRSSCDFFNIRFQPKCAGVEMIRIPHVHSNILMIVELGVVNSQFYKFLKLCGYKNLPNGQSCFSKGNRLPFKSFFLKIEGLVLKEKFLIRIFAFGIFGMILLQVRRVILIML